MNIKITTVVNGTTRFVAKREDTSEYIGITSSINDVADLLIELGKSMKTDKNQ